MGYPYSDTYTYISYLIVGLVCVLSIHISKGESFSSQKEFKGFSILFTTLFLFAVLRKVGLHLGGEDALTYQTGFIDYFNNGSERYQSTDILFGLLTGAIRFMTDNPYIYRGVCYSIIIVGYIRVIKVLSPQHISPIPFICILIPFMRSLNTMRNSISISLFLFALVAFYNRKFYQCLIWMIMSILMHRLSIIMIIVFPSMILYDKYLKNRSKWGKWGIVIIVGSLMMLSYLASRLLQNYVLLIGLFAESSNADFWYMTNNIGGNILLNWPMYLLHLMLLVCLMWKYENLPDNPKIKFLIGLFFFDLIMLPATLVLGMWRYTEYLYIPNLILWGCLIPCFYKDFILSSRMIVRMICLTGFSALMLIRLSREWYEAALMPYKLFFQ